MARALAEIGRAHPQAVQGPEAGNARSAGFPRRNNPKPNRNVLQVNPDHYGMGSDVTNLCKDEIYLLSPNTDGLFLVARC